MDEAHREVEALPHPAGVGPRGTVRGLSEVHGLEEFVDPVRDLPRREVVQPALEDEVLPPREVVVHADLLGCVPDDPADRGGLPHDVVAVHADPARRRPEEGREDLDRRALPRPVGAEEAEHLAPVHAERDPVDRSDVRLEDLPEAVDLDDRVHGDPRNPRVPGL